ncbi:hypothetical protein SAMN05444672_14029 [Bacillus sp. OK838]|nr:hypothetical protein SAMN05444672_14029 [Bacillus sp. OK838]
MAEEERDRIRQREGIDVALQNGVHFGRPKAQVTEEFKEVYDLWKAGEMTAVKAMAGLGIKKTTFYKLIKEYEKDSKKPLYNRRNSSKKVAFAQRDKGLLLFIHFPLKICFHASRELALFAISILFSNCLNVLLALWRSELFAFPK